MPQPIDFQSEIARTTAAERVQQIVDRASLVGQQRMAHEAEAQRVASETQVHETNPKSEHVDRDLKRHNPFMGKRKHRTEGESDGEQEAASGRPEPPVIMDPNEEHHLNITI